LCSRTAVGSSGSGRRGVLAVLEPAASTAAAGLTPALPRSTSVASDCERALGSLTPSADNPDSETRDDEDGQKTIAKTTTASPQAAIKTLRARINAPRVNRARRN